MDKFNPAVINKLISFDKQEEIANMTPEQKIAFKNALRKSLKSAVLYIRNVDEMCMIYVPVIFYLYIKFLQN